jgi:zinc transporter ZupT
MNYWFVYILITLASGLGFAIALKYKDKKHIVLGFSAGALIAAGVFIFIPESIEHIDTGLVLPILISLAMFALLSLFRKHAHSEYIGPGAVASHGYIDGLVGGIVSSVSSLAALPVLASLLIHRFTDGLSVGSLALRGNSHDGGGGASRKALIGLWIVLTVTLPLAGIVSGHYVSISEFLLGIAFALLAGIFLYLAVVDIIPELRHHHAKAPTVVAVVMGFLIIASMAMLHGHE